MRKEDNGLENRSPEMSFENRFGSSFRYRNPDLGEKIQQQKNIIPALKLLLNFIYCIQKVGPIMKNTVYSSIVLCNTSALSQIKGCLHRPPVGFLKCPSLPNSASLSIAKIGLIWCKHNVRWCYLS